MNANRRKFNWVSSTDPSNQTSLNLLSKRMASFYADASSRDSYQEMLDQNDNSEQDPGEVTGAFVQYVNQLKPQHLLEVGCGSGRIYQHLPKNIDYLGIEMSEKVIESNRRRFPEARWKTGTAYEVGLANDSIDLCFSFYVIEHLVFPEKALAEMLRIMKPGGKLALIFPDFVSTGRLPSQSLGLSEIPTASQKLKRGKILDALVSLYDSRIRLKRRLNKIKVDEGEFMINLNPTCFTEKELAPDIDAVYIASKKEIEHWALHHRLKVEYPFGKNGIFDEHSFIVLTK